MKYIFILLALAMCNSSIAQHCPYDGSHLIAFKIVDKNGKLIKTTSTKFYLQEIDNDLADSCTSAAGIIKKQLLTTEEYVKDCKQRWDRNGYSKALLDRLTKANVFKNSNMFVYLNQSEHTCTLIGKSETVYTNYIYAKRKFEITYTVNKKVRKIKVPATAVFSLCTGSNDLENFKTITLIL